MLCFVGFDNAIILEVSPLHSRCAGIAVEMTLFILPRRISIAKDDCRTPAGRNDLQDAPLPLPSTLITDA